MGALYWLTESKLLTALVLEGLDEAIPSRDGVDGARARSQPAVTSNCINLMQLMARPRLTFIEKSQSM